MPNSSLMLGAVAAVVIGALGYFIDTSASVRQPDTMALARNTCEVTIGTTQGFPQSLTPTEACECIFTEMMPRFDEETRRYLIDVYVRTETGAPNSIAERTRYDADFFQRVQAVLGADRLSNPAASLKVATQLQGMGAMDLGPKCKTLMTR